MTSKLCIISFEKKMVLYKVCWNLGFTFFSNDSFKKYDNYSLVFVIFINFFGQLKNWVGQVLFLVSLLSRFKTLIRQTNWRKYEALQPKKRQQING
jgi:hypothetical protein